MCACCVVWVNTRALKGPRGVRSPGAGVTGLCEWPHMGAGNLTLSVSISQTVLLLLMLVCFVCVCLGVGNKI